MRSMPSIIWPPCCQPAVSLHPIPLIRSMLRARSRCCVGQRIKASGDGGRFSLFFPAQLPFMVCRKAFTAKIYTSECENGSGISRGRCTAATSCTARCSVITTANIFGSSRPRPRLCSIFARCVFRGSLAPLPCPAVGPAIMHRK